MEQTLLNQGTGLDEQSFKDDPADRGRFIGLVTLIGVGVLTAGFSVVFPHSYVREVNGPVVGTIVAVFAGILWGATHYVGSNVTDPVTRNKVTGIKTAMVFGLATGAIVAVASYAYRGRTGGLEINGIEASAVILVWFIFSTIVQKVKIVLGNQ